MLEVIVLSWLLVSVVIVLSLLLVSVVMMLSWLLVSVNSCCDADSPGLEVPPHTVWAECTYLR